MAIDPGNPLERVTQADFDDVRGYANSFHVRCHRPPQVVDYPWADLYAISVCNVPVQLGFDFAETRNRAHASR